MFSSACTKVNDSGALIPDEDCIRSESMGIPSPSPSEQPSAKSPASGDSIAEGVYIGIGCAILVVTAAFSISLILLRKYRKHRNRESDKHFMNSERYFVVKSN